ncbi:MAG: hypothetical protein LC122_14115 [Chitinophagales bacterium]|nr:hypothetical protein [Chitinophagales bacterium]
MIQGYFSIVFSGNNKPEISELLLENRYRIFKPADQFWKVYNKFLIMYNCLLQDHESPSHDKAYKKLAHIIITNRDNLKYLSYSIMFGSDFAAGTEISTLE